MFNCENRKHNPSCRFDFFPRFQWNKPAVTFPSSPPPPLRPDSSVKDSNPRPSGRSRAIRTSGPLWLLVLSCASKCFLLWTVWTRSILYLSSLSLTVPPFLSPIQLHQSLYLPPLSSLVIPPALHNNTQPSALSQYVFITDMSVSVTTPLLLVFTRTPPSELALPPHKRWCTGHWMAWDNI